MVTVSPALARQLRDAVRDQRWVHHIDCQTFAFEDHEIGIETHDCTCGIPDLLTALDALLTPTVARKAGEAQRAA